MDLGCDWKEFQALFGAKWMDPRNAVRGMLPLFLVVENGRVVCAFSDGDDNDRFFGLEVSQVVQNLKPRDVVWAERRDIERWYGEAIENSPHFLGQSEYLAQASLGKVNSRKVVKLPQIKPYLLHDHFLVEAIESWWKKIFPASYGVFIRLEDQENPVDYLLTIKNGKIEGYQHPDLQILGKLRIREDEQVIKYLSERAILPIQGIFTTRHEWNEWARSEDAWRLVRRSIQNRAARLFPNNGKLTALIATRAYLGL